MEIRRGCFRRSGLSRSSSWAACSLIGDCRYSGRSSRIDYHALGLARFVGDSTFILQLRRIGVIVTGPAGIRRFTFRCNEVAPRRLGKENYDFQDISAHIRYNRHVPQESPARLQLRQARSTLNKNKWFVTEVQKCLHIGSDCCGE